MKEKNQAQTPEIVNASTIILEDIEQFTISTEEKVKSDIKNIATTEYVRLVKHKSKVLFDFTQKGSKLTEKQKGKVKELYKRLRVTLKEIDKFNQTKIESKVSSKELEYVEAKVSPKKKEKGSSNLV